MTAPREIAVAYDIKVDGFAQIALKQLRNPRNPAVVWMTKATWMKLATHATREGEFYIPCREGLLEAPQLRMLVLREEIP